MGKISVGLISSMIAAVPFSSFGQRDPASTQVHIGQCLLSLKDKNLLPDGAQLGPGEIPTTFSLFSKEEPNIILFHTPKSSYKINLVGTCESYIPQADQGYFNQLSASVQKATPEVKKELHATCGKVEELAALFKAKPAEKK